MGSGEDEGGPRSVQEENKSDVAEVESNKGIPLISKTRKKFQKRQTSCGSVQLPSISEYSQPSRRSSFQTQRKSIVPDLSKHRVDLCRGESLNKIINEFTQEDSHLQHDTAKHLSMLTYDLRKSSEDEFFDRWREHENLAVAEVLSAIEKEKRRMTLQQRKNMLAAARDVYKGVIHDSDYYTGEQAMLPFKTPSKIEIMQRMRDDTNQDRLELLKKRARIVRRVMTDQEERVMFADERDHQPPNNAESFKKFIHGTNSELPPIKDSRTVMAHKVRSSKRTVDHELTVYLKKVKSEAGMRKRDDPTNEVTRAPAVKKLGLKADSGDRITSENLLNKNYLVHFAVKDSCINDAVKDMKALSDPVESNKAGRSILKVIRESPSAFELVQCQETGVVKAAKEKKKRVSLSGNRKGSRRASSPAPKWTPKPKQETKSNFDRHKAGSKLRRRMPAWKRKMMDEINEVCRRDDNERFLIQRRISDLLERRFLPRIIPKYQRYFRKPYRPACYLQRVNIDELQQLPQPPSDVNVAEEDDETDKENMFVKRSTVFFRERLLKACGLFVVRQELITGSVDFGTAISVTFSRCPGLPPWQPYIVMKHMEDINKTKLERMEAEEEEEGEEQTEEEAPVKSRLSVGKNASKTSGESEGKKPTSGGTLPSTTKQSDSFGGSRSKVRVSFSGSENKTSPSLGASKSSLKKSSHIVRFVENFQIQNPTDMYTSTTIILSVLFGIK